MTDRITCTAIVTYTINFSGSKEELIRLAETLNGRELDSRDLGDSMGVFIDLMAREDLDLVGDAGGLLHGEMNMAPFQWEGPIADYRQHSDCPGFDQQEFHWHCHTHNVFDQPYR